MVNAATRDDDEASLICALQLPYLHLSNIIDSNAATYLKYLSHAHQCKMVSMPTLNQSLSSVVCVFVCLSVGHVHLHKLSKNV